VVLLGSKRTIDGAKQRSHVLWRRKIGVVIAVAISGLDVLKQSSSIVQETGAIQSFSNNIAFSRIVPKSARHFENIKSVSLLGVVVHTSWFQAAAPENLAIKRGLHCLRMTEATVAVDLRAISSRA
jgi:hypothetical protein